MKNINELKRVLITKDTENVTLAQLMEAKKIYKTIAQEGYKTKQWTETNLAQAIMRNTMMDFIENSNLDDYSKTIFINGNGYNVSLSQKNDDGSWNNLISVKVRSEDFIAELMDKYNFRLI